MARDFNGSTQYVEHLNTGVTFTPPLSIACWAMPGTDTVQGMPVSVRFYDGSTSGYFNFSLQFAGHIGGDPVRVIAQDSLNPIGIAATSTGYTVDTWHHAAGVFTSATSRAVFIDGGSKDTNSTSVTPANTPDSISIGYTNEADDTVPNNYFDGLVAEVAIWDIALTDAEVAILALGYSPLLIRPQSLVSYPQLFGRTSPEIDIVGGYDMTLANAPTTAAHPPVMYPSRQIYRTFAPTGGLSVNISPGANYIQVV